MKKCVKCGTVADSKFCPNCGSPMPEEDNMLEPMSDNGSSSENISMEDKEVTSEEAESPREEIAENSKKLSKKTIIIIILALVFAAIIGAVLIGHAVSKSNAENSYAATLNALSNEVISGAADAEEQCNLIISVWHDSIFEETNDETKKYTAGTDDFNDALDNLFADEDFQATNESIETSRDLVDMYMEELKNPPEKYAKCYDTALELYGKYKNFTNMALDPTGSYETFTDDFSEADDETVELYEKFVTMIPSVE